MKIWWKSTKNSKVGPDRQTDKLFGDHNPLVHKNDEIYKLSVWWNNRKGNKNNALVRKQTLHILNRYLGREGLLDCKLHRAGTLSQCWCHY